MSILTSTAVAAGALLVCGAAQAALVDRGGGMIYDDVLDITWLQDWNYVKTSGHDSNGEMFWGEANAWANNLVYGGYDDWRLPTVSPVNGSTIQPLFSNNGSTDAGYAKTGAGGGWGLASEMGHLYYVTLKNKGYCTPNDAAPASCTEQTGWNLTNTTGPFSNVQNAYWNDTVYQPLGPFHFAPLIGFQSSTDQFEMYAVAVRPGDVTPVSEPQALALVLFALGLTALVRRKAG